MRACRYCGLRHSEGSCDLRPVPFGNGLWTFGEGLLWMLLAFIVGFLVGSVIMGGI